MTNKLIFSIDNIAEILYQLSEKIVKREGQFEKVPLYNSIVSPVFINYLKFFKEIEEKQKKDLLCYLVSFSKHLIKDAVIGDQPIYAKKYPQLSEEADKFRNWYFRKPPENDNIVIDFKKLEKLNIRKIIQKEIKEKYADFTFDKKNSKFGAISFEKKISDLTFFKVVFSTGRNRQFFDVGIGLNKPFFLVDIGCFFARPQSMFDYNNQEDIEKGVYEAFDVIKTIYRYFLEKTGQNL